MKLATCLKQTTTLAILRVVGIASTSRSFLASLFRLRIFFNSLQMKTLALLILCVGSVVLADDFKTVDGKEYKNATVSRVEPDGIVITFSGGIVKLPFVELAP